MTKSFLFRLALVASALTIAIWWAYRFDAWHYIRTKEVVRNDLVQLTTYRTLRWGEHQGAKHGEQRVLDKKIGFVTGTRYHEGERVGAATTWDANEAIIEQSLGSSKRHNPPWLEKVRCRWRTDCPHGYSVYKWPFDGMGDVYFCGRYVGQAPVGTWTVVMHGEVYKQEDFRTAVESDGTARAQRTPSTLRYDPPWWGVEICNECFSGIVDVSE